MNVLAIESLRHLPPDAIRLDRAGYIGQNPEDIRLRHQRGELSLGSPPSLVYNVSYTSEHPVREAYIAMPEGGLLRVTRGYGIELRSPGQRSRTPTPAEIQKALEQVKGLGQALSVEDLTWIMTNPLSPTQKTERRIVVPTEIEFILYGWVKE